MSKTNDLGEYELHTQVILSERLEYIDQTQSNDIQDKLNNLQRMSVSFKVKLEV